MKKCYKLLGVFPVVLLLFFLSSFQANAQLEPPYRFIETFGVATTDNSNYRKSNSANGEVEAYFQNEKLDYIRDDLEFYDGVTPLPGQTMQNQWGPVYTGTGNSRKGAYSVVTNSRGYNQQYFYAGEDHTPDDENGFMLLVDAHNNTTLYFDRTLTTADGLKPGRGYNFSLRIKNVNNEVSSGKPAPEVQISIYDADKYESHNSLTGRLAVATGAPPANTASSGDPQWHKIELKILSLPAGVNSVRLQIKNVVTSELGNDLAIDDIEFRSLEVLAVDDKYDPFCSSVGGVTPNTVLVNDKVNNLLFDPSATPLPVTLTPGTSPLPGQILMNPDGTITVQPGTAPGTYSYPYTICSTDPDFTSVCDQANAHFEVLSDDETYIGGTVTVQGTGAALKRIPMSLVPQFEGGVTLRQYTSSLGEFRFRNVAPGRYLLQVQDQTIIVNKSLFPVESSLYWDDVLPCKPVLHHFVYGPSNMPVIGDFVWLDVNADGIQNEWYDANEDNKISKNAVDFENFQMIDYKKWEWIDLNDNNTWDQPGDEGELNRAGLGSAAYQNKLLQVQTTMRIELLSVWMGYGEIDPM